MRPPLIGPQCASSLQVKQFLSLLFMQRQRKDLTILSKNDFFIFMLVSSSLDAENKMKSKEKLNTSSAEKRPGIEKKSFQNVDIFRLVIQGFNKVIDMDFIWR